MSTERIGKEHGGRHGSSITRMYGWLGGGMCLLWCMSLGGVVMAGEAAWPYMYAGDRPPNVADESDPAARPQWNAASVGALADNSDFTTSEGLAMPGYLRLESSAPLRPRYTYEGDAWQIDDAFTIEFRLRVISAEGDAAWEVVAGNEDRRIIFRVGPDRLGFATSGGMVEVAELPDFDPTTFNVYRIVSEKVAERWTYELYVNGHATGVRSSGFGGTDMSLLFGDSSSSFGGVTERDYLRWNPAAALPPSGDHEPIGVQAVRDNEAAADAPAAAGAAMVDEPILAYRFNEGQGTYIHSTGRSDATAWLIVSREVGGDPQSRWSEEGEGVSGRPGDRAFFNADGAEIGVGVGGHLFGESVPELGDLDSFTVSGWLRAGGAQPNSLGLLFMNHRSPNGFGVSKVGPNRLRVYVNDKYVDTSALHDAGEDEWVFFAVTYDATAADKHARFYVGARDEPVRLAHEATLQVGKVGAHARPFVMASGLGGSRPFQGYLDNMRVYGSSADGGAALDLARLEALRAADVAYTPTDYPALRSSDPQAEIVELRKIWQQGPHSAFTDLIRFQGRWYCTFREAERHHTTEGGMCRIVVSDDTHEWESVAEMAIEGYDVRELKFLITPDDRLLALAGAADLRGESMVHRSFAWISDDGDTWEGPHAIDDTEYTWMWRGARFEDRLYSIGYGTSPQHRGIRLYGSDDGINWAIDVPDFYTERYPNESPLLFLEDGTLIMLNRREEGPPPTSQVGIASPPYEQWTWKDLGRRIGGPNMIQLPDGRIVVGTRLWEGGTRTALCWLDLEAGELIEFLTLPSRPDTGYPGLVWHDDHLWVSFYSDPTGETSVYLAKIRIH